MKQKKYAGIWLAVCLMLLAGCGAVPDSTAPVPNAPAGSVSLEEQQGGEQLPDPEGDRSVLVPEEAHPSAPESGTAEPEQPMEEAERFSLDEVPPYQGSPYVAVHGNRPYFTRDEITAESFERYGARDDKNRCSAAFASIGPDLMPTEERGPIGQVKPTGWHTIKYDSVDGKYLYNRCHLIGYQLTGENANEDNLITGTRAMNVDGMLPFENMTADYVKETGNHVLYRVTPVFQGNDLLARGVLMEGYSVEDQGAGVLFCIFAYNAQPGIELDYGSGESREKQTEPPAQPQLPPEPERQPQPEPTGQEYVLNTNTKKFHLPSCGSVKDMKEKNKQILVGTRDEVIAMGYKPCGRCHP